MAQVLTFESLNVPAECACDEPLIGNHAKECLAYLVNGRKRYPSGTIIYNTNTRQFQVRTREGEWVVAS